MRRTAEQQREIDKKQTNLKVRKYSKCFEPLKNPKK